MRRRADLRAGLAVEKDLDGPLPHKGSDVVRIIRQAVQGKRCVVLQVGVVAADQLQQWDQPASLSASIQGQKHPGFAPTLLL